MNVTETIRTFLEFFGAQGHQVAPGSSLVPPDGDPVLFDHRGDASADPVPGGPPPSAGQAGWPAWQRCLRTDRSGRRSAITVT